MPTTFGREILGMDVLDDSGDKLGNLADFRLDSDSGGIVSLLVTIEPDIDPTPVSYTHLRAHRDS